MSPETNAPRRKHPEIDAARLGALAHLYRGEVYRSTQWRTRLDNTTNWAVVTTGIALSATFSNVSASPLPMVLVGLLVSVFLIFEARRYRYYNLFRARARLLETDVFSPVLLGDEVHFGEKWADLLAEDYRMPRYHISYARSIGRRLRKNYSWILMVQAIAYYGKIAIHPTPITSLQQAFDRAAIGPIPGELVILAGLSFHLGWLAVAIITLRMDEAYRRRRNSPMARA